MYISNHPLSLNWKIIVLVMFNSHALTEQSDTINTCKIKPAKSKS